MTKKKSDDPEHRLRQMIIEDIRPWGKFRSFPHEDIGSIKIITVNPGSSLSLQYHHHRSEFWVILDEGFEVILGEKIWRPAKSEEIFIPCGVPHRLRCVGQNPARVMELWIEDGDGESGESDIIRLDDDYGRE